MSYPDEPDEESEDWWEFLRENTNHLDSLEGASFTGSAGRRASCRGDAPCGAERRSRRTQRAGGSCRTGVAAYLRSEASHVTK